VVNDSADVTSVGRSFQMWALDYPSLKLLFSRLFCVLQIMSKAVLVKCYSDI